MNDTRIVYGAKCSWWDTIQQASKVGSLPCCPQCFGVLFEVPTEEEWWASAQRYEEDAADPDYCNFILWLRGKCYPTLQMARNAYEARY